LFFGRWVYIVAEVGHIHAGELHVVLIKHLGALNTVVEHLQKHLALWDLMLLDSYQLTNTIKVNTPAKEKKRKEREKGPPDQQGSRRWHF